MSQHRTYNVQTESTLELWPGVESDILIQAQVEIFEDDNYGADADGRRGTLRSEVNSIDIHTLILYVPNRPSLRLFSNEKEILNWLTQPEWDSLQDLVLEKVFRGEGEEI